MPTSSVTLVKRKMQYNPFPFDLTLHNISYKHLSKQSLSFLSMIDELDAIESELRGRLTRSGVALD